MRSLEKWKRVFQDELDMKENEEFLVLKTSMSGWWYAINKKQEDGLIPYMYLEILSDYVDYTTITQHEFAHIEKTVLGWDIHNICKLIFQDQKSTTQEQNILLHSLRNLYIMCQKQDCRYTFLSKGGLDRLHTILLKTFDIAIRTFCLRAMILLAPSIGNIYIHLYVANLRYAKLRLETSAHSTTIIHYRGSSISSTI